MHVPRTSNVGQRGHCVYTERMECSLVTQSVQLRAGAVSGFVRRLPPLFRPGHAKDASRVGDEKMRRPRAPISRRSVRFCVQTAGRAYDRGDGGAVAASAPAVPRRCQTPYSGRPHAPGTCGGAADFDLLHNVDCLRPRQLEGWRTRPRAPADVRADGRCVDAQCVSPCEVAARRLGAAKLVMTGEACSLPQGAGEVWKTTVLTHFPVS